LLCKYCKEGASIVTHFWVPRVKRRKKIKKIIAVKRGCQNVQKNSQKLVEEVQKYKDENLTAYH
jgi:hypothetical protein